MSGFSIPDILGWIGGRVVNSDALGPAMASVRAEKLAPLGVSSERDLAFFFSKAYQSELLSCQASVLVTGDLFVLPLQQAQLPLWQKTAVISVPDPYFALAVLSEHFARGKSSVFHDRTGMTDSEIHPTAVVHPTAQLGPGIQVGPHCVIEEGAVIGARSVLYSGCFVGSRARIGDDCVLFPNVVLYEWVEMGHRVRIHAGSVLGADGFGYAPVRGDGKVVGHRKIYHLGRVVIGDDVEIGANSCVDRSTFGETRIGNQAKLDNHVHIGHNASVGDGAILCGGVCLAGSAIVADFAYIGGMSGISNHIEVGARAMVGACSLISKDVPPSEMAVGNPQRDRREHFRVHAWLSKAARRSKSLPTAEES